MSLDEILEFLFRKAWGVLLLCVTTVLCALAMTGCLPLDFCGCFCEKACGLDTEAKECYSCSSECDEVCYECTTLGMTGCGGEPCAVQSCLFLDEGCRVECGDCLTHCQGVNASLLITCAEEGCNAYCGGDEFTRCVFLNCYTYCDKLYDPQSPDYNKIFVATITIMHDEYSEAKDLYMRDTGLDVPYAYDSSLTFSGYYSLPNGKGTRYTDENGKFYGGAFPPNGAILYPYFVSIYANEQFVIHFYGINIEQIDYENPLFNDGYAMVSYDEYIAGMFRGGTDLEFEGYNFLGWYTESSNSENAKIGNEDGIYSQYFNFNPLAYPDKSGNAILYYTAYWETIDDRNYRAFNLYALYSPKKPTVTIVLPDGTSSPRTVAYNTTVGEIKAPEYEEDVTFIRFTYDQLGFVEASKEDAIKEDITLYAMYTSKVTVNFKDHTGEIVSTEIYPAGTTVDLPEPQERAGYEFMGWMFENSSFGSNKFTSLNISTTFEGVVLVPYWQEKMYKITYMVGDEEIKGNGPDFYFYHSEDGTYKTLLNIDPAEFGYGFYTFAGWLADGIFTPITSITTSIASDVILTAKLDPKSFDVYFDTGTSYVVNPIRVYYDSHFELAVPTRNGYTFTGWYLNGYRLTDGFGLSTMELRVGQNGIKSSDLAGGSFTVTAGWEKTKHKISFIADSEEIYSYELLEGSEVNELPSVNPTKYGYEFVGWEYAGFPCDPIGMRVDGPKIFTARFIPITYTVNLYLCDGTDEFITATYKFGDTNISFEAPTRDGYSFQGWYSEPGESGVMVINSGGLIYPNFNKNVDGVSVYAHWAEAYAN